MAKKLSPRAKFIASAGREKLASVLWDTMIQASTHDPDQQAALTLLTNITDKLANIADMHTIEIKGLKRDANILFTKFHDIQNQIDIINRQLQRIGAPQYRRVRKGVYAEIVRGPKSAKALKDE